jgi:[ribosomal protein S5]-alanine N-acetyltransferase
MPAPFPSLRTSRLWLNEIVDRDAPRLFDVFSNADHMRYNGNDAFVTLGEAEQMVRTFASWRAQPAPGTRWAIRPTADAALIGTCGLFRWNARWHSCTIGYELHPAHTGRGHMREALEAIIAYGWREMQLHRIEAQIHPDNAASIKLVQALGFVHEGTLRDAGHWAGAYHPLAVYGLIKAT